MKPDKKSIRIVHAPGALNAKAEKEGFYDDLSLNIKVSNNLSIVSIMNEPCKNKSYIYKQCLNNNIDLIIPNSTYNIKTKWKNTYKIDGILEALNKIKTDYVLILDGKDVKIVGDLDDEFLDLFLEFKKDIIFNGNEHPWPGELLENEIGIEYANTMLYFITPFINAGVCIGKRDKLIKFYKECKDYIEKNNVNEQDFPSEQLVVRNVASKSDVSVGVDTYLKIFSLYSKYRRLD